MRGTRARPARLVGVEVLLARGSLKNVRPTNFSPHSSVDELVRAGPVFNSLGTERARKKEERRRKKERKYRRKVAELKASI